MTMKRSPVLHDVYLMYFAHMWAINKNPSRERVYIAGSPTCKQSAGMCPDDLLLLGPSLTCHWDVLIPLTRHQSQSCMSEAYNPRQGWNPGRASQGRIRSGDEYMLYNIHWPQRIRRQVFDVSSAICSPETEAKRWHFNSQTLLIYNAMCSIWAIQSQHKIKCSSYTAAGTTLQLSGVCNKNNNKSEVKW